MNIDLETGSRIVKIARTYLSKQYDYKTFDCVHFVVEVYNSAGILIPFFKSRGLPPDQLMLREFELEEIPLGRIATFKRKLNTTSRAWSHMAIVYSPNEFIHCSKHFGNCVTITPKFEFLEIYTHIPK